MAQNFYGIKAIMSVSKYSLVSVFVEIYLPGKEINSKMLIG